MADRDDIDAAISRVEESRQTHVLWRDYWIACDAHACPAGPCSWEIGLEETAAVAGDLAHQLSAIAGYDHVLDVLRSISPCD